MLSLFALRAGFALVAFVALVTFFPLLSLLSLFALRAGFTLVAFISFIALLAGVALVTFFSLLTLGSGISLVTFISLLAFFTLGPCVALVAFLSLVAGCLTVIYPFSLAVSDIPASINNLQFRGNTALASSLERLAVRTQDRLSVKRPVVCPVRIPFYADAGGTPVLAVRTISTVLTIFSVENGQLARMVKVYFITCHFSVIVNLLDGSDIVPPLQDLHTCL